MSERLCVFCPHFQLELGSDGYSAETLGHAGRVSCTRDHWEIEPSFLTMAEDDFRAHIQTAAACPDYLPVDGLRAHPGMNPTGQGEEKQGGAQRQEHIEQASGLQVNETELRAHTYVPWAFVREVETANGPYWQVVCDQTTPPDVEAPAWVTLFKRVDTPTA
jgi:DNA-binding transcriptional regulator YdaS (Cro superfamily)